MPVREIAVNRAGDDSGERKKNRHDNKTTRQAHQGAVSGWKDAHPYQSNSTSAISLRYLYLGFVSFIRKWI